MLLVEQPEPLKVADFLPTYNPNLKKPAAPGTRPGSVGITGILVIMVFLIASGPDHYHLNKSL
jgi:hypothetical protein